MPQSTNDEYRRFDRVDACDAEAFISIKGSLIESRCLNLGVGGMALAVNETMPRGETYFLSMMRPPFQTIEAQAQVVWAKQDDPSEWSQVGLRFTRLSQSALKTLCSYRHHLGTRKPN